jgi:hypothetical protein
MRSFMLLIATVSVCGLLVAARIMAVAKSPPAAYAAAILGVAAVGALCLSLLIIWLAAA